MRVLKTPREVRNAVAYVLNNWDRADHAKAWKIDPFSNAWQFNGWKERDGEWLAYRVEQINAWLDANRVWLGPLRRPMVTLCSHRW
jgi:hypothetical protein